MTVERDEGFEPWPGEADPIAVAACPLLACVMEMSESGSPERARAMTEVLAALDRVRAILARPRLN
jgi:hypothetical protein